MKTINTKDYELIIFDCDGTLVDSEPLSNSVIAQMMRDLGIEISNKEALDLFMGTSIATIIDYIEKDQGIPLEFNFEDHYRKKINLVFKEQLKAIPGVVEFISKLNCAICVASNGPRNKMQTTLSLTGLTKYFADDNIFSAHDIQKWKPKPDLFLYAAKKMKIPIDACLVIEDSMAGALGAIEAKMDLLVYTGAHNPEPFTDKKIQTFSHFNQLQD